MQLTEHFADTEMGVANCSEQLIENARHLCEMVLEPMRDHFGPVLVHDGFRDESHNARVGGKKASYHLFINGEAAADVGVDGVPYVQVFDWLRLMSHLPFDKVILEHDKNGTARCVHIQIDRFNVPRREAFIGETGAGEVYTPVPVNP